MHSNVCCGIYSQELRYKSNPMNELINQWISINGQMNIEVMTNTHANTNWNIFSDIKKNEILAICDNMDGCRGFYAK